MGSRALMEAKADETQRDVSRDLFLWAVVQKNKELAEIAWEQVNEAKMWCLCAVCVCAYVHVSAFVLYLRHPESSFPHSTAKVSFWEMRKFCLVLTTSNCFMTVMTWF